MANKSIGLLNIVFGADLRGFDKAMKKAQKSIGKFGKNLQRTGKNLTRNLTAPLMAFAAVSVKNFDTQIKAETKLLTALKGREDIQKRLIAQAKELQTKTLFGDEATIEAQALLASLGLTEEQILMLIPQIQNMSTGLGMDLVGATSLVSKSVSTTTDALARYFNTGLKGVIGQQERAIVLTQALTDKFEGQAEMIAKQGLGPWQQLSNTLGDVSEEFGKIILDNIQPLNASLQRLAATMESMDNATKESIVKWGAFAAIIGPFVLIVGHIVSAFGKLIGVISILGKHIAKHLGIWGKLAVVIAVTGKGIAQMITGERELTDLEKNLVKQQEEWNKELEKTNTETNKLLPKIPKITKAVKQYSDAISSDITKTDWVFGMSLKDDEPEALEWIPELTQKQKELNATAALFGDIMHNAMMDAADSQEGFFQSLFENLRKAIRQMLIQLAVLTAINILLGGKGVVEAFNLAKGKLLGLANGGLATGPTMALIGEGSGTSISNPEVVAPLDKLKNYMGGDMRVTGRLVGNDIFLSNEKAGVSRNRFV